MRDFPIPPDVSAWLALWEASMKDQGNDQIAAVAGSFLLEILADRGVLPPPVKRRGRCASAIEPEGV